MGSPGHICQEIRGEKILLWCPDYPRVHDNDRSPIWGGHRAYKVTATGGGGRPAYAKVVIPWNIIDREGLHKRGGGA